MHALTRPRRRSIALSMALLPVWFSASLPCHAQNVALLSHPDKLTPEEKHPVFADKELLITDKAVVDSEEARYPGHLSFGYVMEQLAGKDRAGTFTLEWLRLWLTDQEINRDTAPARPAMEGILEAWRRKDQKGDVNDPLGWSPNLANAPFKLIAVVNRMDLLAPSMVEKLRLAREAAAQQLAFLRGNTLAMAAPLKNKAFTPLGEVFHRSSTELPSGFTPVRFPGVKVKGGAAGTAEPEFVAGPDAASSYYGLDRTLPFLTGPGSGEGRLIFAVTDPEGKPLEPAFTVIFEYRLPDSPVHSAAQRSRTAPTMEWARKWHWLGTHKEFDAHYLTDLVTVTRGFTDQGKGKNSSEAWSPPPLAQIRTNDGALDKAREFREFRFIPGTQPIDPDEPSVMPRLRQAPLVQTPAEKYLAVPDSRVLASVLKTQQENFRKEAPVILPISVQFPNEIEPTGLLGARALLPADPLTFSWKVDPLNDRALSRHFSHQTCNGCHGSDANCVDGLHVKGGPEYTMLSAFLSPDGDGKAHGELKDRATILSALLEPGDRESDLTLVRLLHKRHRASH